GESANPFFLQEDIYSRLSGEPAEIFIPANVQGSGDENGEPVREYRVIADADGEMYFYMSDLIGSHSNLEIYYNNEFLTYYGNDACLKVLNLGYFERGDYFIVHVKAEDADDFGEAFFVTEDTQALKEAYEKTVSRHATVTTVSASKLAMTLDSAYTVGDDISGEVGVFTTIPFQKGWKVKVSGVKVEPIEVYDALMYIPVTEALQQAELGPDENIRIELSFIPEGFYLGVGISIFAVIVIVLMASIRKGEASFFGEEDYEEETGGLFTPPES
ncbi:MAG: YfhO family protein, partial [Lachnospiraceae bacterium]|nr:YfhO family protein [Lachnospiraceae bacterium]